MSDGAERIAYINSQIACMQAEIAAMQASNILRSLKRLPPAYTHDDFASLPYRYGIDSLSVRKYLGLE